MFRQRSRPIGTLPKYTEATSYTGFNYVATQTVYTRFGDWFPLLCAMLAVLGLVAAQVADSYGR